MEPLCWNCGDPISDEEIVAGECSKCGVDLTLCAMADLNPGMLEVDRGDAVHPS